MYSVAVLENRSYGEDMNLEVDEWLSVLSLSSMWGFTKMRSAAIERLQSVNIDLVTKVCPWLFIPPAILIE